MMRAETSTLRVAQAVADVNHALREHEIEKARVSHLIDILSDFSTQAALLAGCAIAAVSGESLDSLDDDLHSWDRLGRGAFIISSAIAVGTSLWVIFISSHLISLTRDTATRPKIKKAREILEDNVRDVRGMLWVALFSLLLSCLATAWLNTSAGTALTFSLVLILLVWQALLKKDHITNSFNEHCGKDWAQADSFFGVLCSWLRPWEDSWIGKIVCCCCCCCCRGSDEVGHQRLRESHSPAS
jgi:hypothetical protein